MCFQTDADECSFLSQEDGADPPCTQICLNTMGSYLCACHHGFKLDADQRTCVREFYTEFSQMVTIHKRLMEIIGATKQKHALKYFMKANKRVHTALNAKMHA